MAVTDAEYKETIDESIARLKTFNQSNPFILYWGEEDGETIKADGICPKDFIEAVFTSFLDVPEIRQTFIKGLADKFEKELEGKIAKEMEKYGIKRTDGFFERIQGRKRLTVAEWKPCMSPMCKNPNATTARCIIEDGKTVIVLCADCTERMKKYADMIGSMKGKNENEKIQSFGVALIRVLEANKGKKMGFGEMMEKVCEEVK